jgi:hypothetical protein
MNTARKILVELVRNGAGILPDPGFPECVNFSDGKNNPCTFFRNILKFFLKKPQPYCDEQQGQSKPIESLHT